MAFPFRRVGISGLGLIGGSMARAIASVAPGVVLSGADPDPDTRALAVASGLFAGVEAGTAGIAAAVDLLILAAPVASIEADLRALASRADLSLAVTDVGSSKGSICRLGTLLPESIRFVGGHPMAGSAERGFGASRADLFRGAPYAVMVPASPTSAEVHALVTAVGARVIEVSPEDHDRAVAATSHLPQLVAVALANVVGAVAERDPHVLELHGRALEDMTRIAASAFSVWEPILAANREAIAGSVEAFHRELALVLDPDTAGDSFTRAASLRQRI